MLGALPLQSPRLPTGCPVQITFLLFFEATCSDTSPNLCRAVAALMQKARRREVFSQNISEQEQSPRVGMGRGQALSEPIWLNSSQLKQRGSPLLAP